MSLRLIYIINTCRLVLLSIGMLGVSSVYAETPWNTSTQSFHQTSIQFQLPGRLETTTQGQIQYWKTQADGNSYWVAAKIRRCSHSKAPLRICDVSPILRSILRTSKQMSRQVDQNGYIHLVSQEGKSFYYTSICYNDKIVVVLITQTADEHSLDHQRFIESFVFLK